MASLVQVSSIEKTDKLKKNIEELFRKERYPEITQSIGMHSILIDPQHMISDQSDLYGFVLSLIKDRIRRNKGKSYGTWYTDFPKLMDRLISAKQVVSDKASADVLSSRREAFGPFKSMDDFYFWALDDRRLTLDQLVKYIEKTAELHGKQ